MAGLKTWGSTDVVTSSDVNTFLMQQAIPRFTTTTLRNAAIASPATGQMAATDDFGEVYIYNGTVWVGTVPRVVYKPLTTTRTTATMTNDPDLVISLEASSRYIMSFDFQYQTTAASDFQFLFTYTGTMADSKVGYHFIPVAATTQTNSVKGLDALSTPLVTVAQVGGLTSNVLGTFGHGYWHTSTAGTLALSWARVAGTDPIDLSLGSFMKLLKVA